MAYIPAHKRPLPTPELLAPQFWKQGMHTVFSADTRHPAPVAARGGRPGTFRGRGKGYGGIRGGISATSGMAYIPPHKWHSKESERPLPTSELHAQRFKKNLNVKPFNKSNVDWTGRIAIADHSTYRWCAAAARGGRPGTFRGRGNGYRGFRGGISARSGTAHIPPHKRHSKECERPLLASELRAQRFKKNFYVKPYNKCNVDWTGRIAHADHSTYRWCAVALGEENQFPPSVTLKPICLYSTEPKVEENRLALFNTSLDDEGDELKWNSPRSPGVSIAENVLADLVSSIKHMRNEMKCAQLKVGRPTLIARVGKVLFIRNPLFNMEAIRTSLSTEILKQWRRLLYTNIPVSYKERIENEVVPKIGVDFEGEKDTYQVKLSDSTRPDATLSCKCRVMKEHGKLQLYKIELNQLRNMVVDISCTTKNLDLRLMLCTKRLVTDLTDDEMQSIRDLINSAIVDPDVKGGLRWPWGKDSSGDKYKVDGVWHLISNTYKNSSFRLKVRRADRFDYRTLTGGVTWETILMLKRVLSKLQEENAEASSVSEILKEDMQLIWDNFLSCEGFLT